VGAQFIQSGAHKKVLVIGSDVNSCMVDYTDRAVCVIFGDGAGAVVLEPCAGDDPFSIMDFHHEVDGSGGQWLYRPGGGSLLPGWDPECTPKKHYIHQEGQQVFKYAVRKMAEVSEGVLTRNGFTGADVDCFIPHQANLRIISATADRLKLPMEKVIVNIDEFGNTTAGTIPLAMETARKQGRLKKGDLTILVAVGGGFTSGALLLRWSI
jgi:3-oxoacyl-[acyl-carrier-protein] synthase-3